MISDDLELVQKASFHVAWVVVGPRTRLNPLYVNSPQAGHLWDRHKVSILERCPSYKESNKGNKKRQGPTLGVRFTEVSVKRESTVVRL